MTNALGRLTAAVGASALALLGSGAPAALAAGLDPNPQPMAGPLAVEPKYQNLAKLQDVVLGKMAIEPVKGDLESLIKFTTAGGCPRGSNTVTRIYGPKLPEGGQNVIGNTYTFDFGSPPADRMKAPMTITLSEVVARQETPVVLDGVYRIWMQCQHVDMDDFSVNFGVFEGKLRINSGKYTALTTSADLPKTPTPKTGPEAYAALDQSNQAPPAPTPMPDAIQQALEKQNASVQSDTGSGSTVAIAVTSGIVALGLIPLGWLWFRQKPEVGRK